MFALRVGRVVKYLRVSAARVERGTVECNKIGHGRCRDVRSVGLGLRRMLQITPVQPCHRRRPSAHGPTVRHQSLICVALGLCCFAKYEHALALDIVLSNRYQLSVLGVLRFTSATVPYSVGKDIYGEEVQVGVHAVCASRVPQKSFGAVFDDSAGLPCVVCDHIYLSAAFKLTLDVSTNNVDAFLCFRGKIMCVGAALILELATNHGQLPKILYRHNVVANFGHRPTNHGQLPNILYKHNIANSGHKRSNG